MIGGYCQFVRKTCFLLRILLFVLTLLSLYVFIDALNLLHVMLLYVTEDENEVPFIVLTPFHKLPKYSSLL